MTNTSATGGYLVPDGVITPPIEDDALDDFMGDVVAAITGLDRDTAVRPRWQAEPPNLPDRTVNWCAVGITHRKADTFASVVHGPTLGGGEGADVLTRHEELDLLISFYGPACQATGALMRDGISIAQNREQLFLAGMGLVSVGDLTKAPEILKSAWYQRADLPLVIRREVRREYPVLNLISAPITLNAPPVVETITPTDPTP